MNRRIATSAGPRRDGATYPTSPADAAGQPGEPCECATSTAGVHGAIPPPAGSLTHAQAACPPSPVSEPLAGAAAASGPSWHLRVQGAGRGGRLPLSGIRTLPTARSRSVLTMSRQRGRGGASWRAGRPRRHSRPGGSSGRFWNRHDRRRLLNTGYRAEGSDWGRPRPDKVKTGNRQAPTPSPTGCQCARTTGRVSSVKAACARNPRLKGDNGCPDICCGRCRTGTTPVLIGVKMRMALP